MIKYKSVIILFFFLQSCITTSHKQAIKDFEYKKILSDTSKSYIYRAKINLYNKDFSGIIIIKPKQKKHRIVFLNEIGMKFFDIELTENSYKIHQIFDPLNKKMFIKLISSDFNFILMNDIKKEKKFLIMKKNDNPALKLKKHKEIYIFDKNTLLPFYAFKYSIFRKNIILDYSDFYNDIPKHIKIKHKNIKFEMNLSFIK